MQTQATPKTLTSRAGAFGLAAAISVAIVAYGQGLWQPLVIANMRFHPEIPSAPTMAVLLAGLLAYLSGRGWPGRTSARRRELFRWNSMPAGTFGFAVFAGLLGLAAFGGLWIAVADLVHIPPGVQPKMGAIPLPTALSFLVMGVLAAPLSEEAAFRGYAMGILSARDVAPAAIVRLSFVFAAVHFLQGIEAVKLSLCFARTAVEVIGYLTNSTLRGDGGPQPGRRAGLHGARPRPGAAWARPSTTCCSSRPWRRWPSSPRSRSSLSEGWPGSPPR